MGDVADLEQAITDVLMDNFEILPDGDAARAVLAELEWSDAPQYEGDLWIVDGESPRSLARKIVAAIAEIR